MRGWTGAIPEMEGLESYRESRLTDVGIVEPTRTQKRKADPEEGEGLGLVTFEHVQNV